MRKGKAGTSHAVSSNLVLLKSRGDFHAAARVLAALHLFFVKGEQWGKGEEWVWVLFQSQAASDFCCSGKGGNSDRGLVYLQLKAGSLLAGLWFFSRDCNMSMKAAPGCLRELGWGRMFCTFPMHNSLRQICGGGEGSGEIEMKSLSGYTWPTQLYRFIFRYCIVLSLRDL